jgi:RNA polymerase sigma factor (TIGR02999 family)
MSETVDYNGPVTSPDEHEDATRLMIAASDGDAAAAERLLPLVYQQLRAAAQLQMATERPGHTLQATALVHEAFLKLVGDRDLSWQNRRHFYVAAAEAMRQILLDHARSRGRLKRGGGRRRVPLSMADVAESWNLEETVSLDEALHRLEAQDGDIAEVVRLRFYAGLSIEQTAEALDISPATVKRRWEFGRTWLYRELGKDAGA